MTNGFDNSDSGTDASVIDFIDDPAAIGNDSMLRVTVGHQVPHLLQKIFGISEIEIERTAVAEYVLPFAMASLDSLFGDDPATGVANRMQLRGPGEGHHCLDCVHQRQSHPAGRMIGDRTSRAPELVSGYRQQVTLF